MLRAIEELNPWCSFSIFHLGTKKDNIRQIYLSLLRRERPLHVQIGVLTHKNDANKVHLVLIQRMTALLNKTKKDQQDICEHCLTLHSKSNIAQHEQDCWSHAPTHIKMPEPTPEDKNWKIEFHQWQYRLPAPFIIYADFECLLMNPQGLNKEEQEQLHHQKAAIVHHHQPCGFAYSIQCAYSEHQGLINPVLNLSLRHIRTYIGPHAEEEFLRCLCSDVQFLYYIVANCEKSYKEQPGDRERFAAATHCHICTLPFQPQEEKVLDHDHFTGLFRGAAHRVCNSKYTTWKERYQVPIVFHNLRGYDSYIVIRAVRKVRYFIFLFQKVLIKIIIDCIQTSRDSSHCQKHG